MATKRLTGRISWRIMEDVRRIPTRLRIEVLGIADLDGTGGAMNGRVVIDGILLGDVFGVYRSVRLALD